jgi:hypothetical protein
VYRFGGYLSTSSQASAFLQVEHYLPGNGLRLGLDTWLARYPTRFFGVGPHPLSSGERYDPLEAAVDISAGLRLAPGLYAGPRLRWFGSRIMEREAGGLLESGAYPGGDGAAVLGPGLRLTYEGRDSQVAATSGLYLDASATLFGRAFGAGSSYALFSLDARAYATPLEGSGTVFAAQFYAAAAAGEAPFQELPRLGGDRLLRGWFEGKYRGPGLVALQAEARIPVWSFLNVALYAGIGQVAERSGAMDFATPLAAAGIGARIVLDKESGAALRLDLAWGEGGPEFYLNLGESF